MRALIIGGNGAIGSAIARYADAAGIETHVGVRTGASVERLSTHPRVGVSRVDAMVGDSVRRAIAALRPDWIVMGALPRAGHAANSTSRRQLLLGMCEGLLGVIEGADQAGFRGKLTWIGSAMAYGEARGPRDPGAVMRPQTFRGAVKAAESLVAARVAADVGIAMSEVRIFTGYGPYEQRERFVASLLRAAVGCDRVRLAKTPASRDWIHYDDIARACLATATGDAPAVLNACTGQLHDTRQVAALLEAITGTALVDEAPYEATERYGDVEPGVVPSASAQFQWQPVVTLEQGLEQCWAWARSPAGREYLLGSVAA